MKIRLKRNGWVIMLDVLVCFCLLGHRLFLYPIDKQIKFKEIALFLALCVIIFPVIKFCLKKNIRYELFFRVGDNKKNGDKKVFFGTFLILFAVEMLYLFAFNPAVVSWDYQMALAQAKGLEPIDYQLNVLIILLTKAIISVCDSVTFLVIVQCVFLNLIISRICVWAYARGIKAGVLFVLTVLYVIAPNNMLMSVTLTKDFIFAGAFLWLLFLCVRILFDSKLKKGIYLELLLCLILLTYSRYNGIVTTIAVMAGLFVYSKRNIKVALIAIAAIVVIVGCLLKSVADVNNGQGTKYVGMTQDMFGVFYAGGALSETTIKYLESLVDLDEYGEVYTPYWAYWEQWNEDFHSANDTNLLRFMGMYIDTFFRNPVKLVRCVLCRVEPIWNIFPGEDAYETWIWQTHCSRYDFYPMMYPNRSNNIATKVLNYMGAYSQNVPFKIIIWRVGIWFVAGFSMLAKTFSKNRKLTFLIVPLITQVLSMVVANAWSHYRYYWNIEVYVFWLGIILLALNKGKILGDCQTEC